MIFKAVKLINSQNKRNLRLVALGSYQAEFFELEGQEYFCVYRQDADQIHVMYINLDESIVTRSEKGFDIVHRSNTFKCIVSSDGEKNLVKITQYWWGWLPYQSMSGKVSSVGLLTLKNSFTSKLDESS